ncbi:hypothetical protein ACOBQX_04195 [Actinokineospora sp. G85]|uniref:hypothetical protein n=1 Tax=Actinokineospora sp. G85 TaxID=3406626 RepID=UPI003C70BC26
MDIAAETLVGHLHPHGGHTPAEASAILTDITSRLDGTRWQVDTAEERLRRVPGTPVRRTTSSCAPPAAPDHSPAVVQVTSARG